jgi:hypothetical protein
MGGRASCREIGSWEGARVGTREEEWLEDEGCARIKKNQGRLGGVEIGSSRFFFSFSFFSLFLEIADIFTITIFGNVKWVDSNCDIVLI